MAAAELGKVVRAVIRYKPQVRQVRGKTNGQLGGRTATNVVVGR